uniref:NAC domain-containing protein n=1 Tax=Ananas comosus var. bracteatus TaxID=296719 RepID=A0A6V7NUI4_ANACO|nr:unnamed protein product [Ananas comosus var. bracteatus]
MNTTDAPLTVPPGFRFHPTDEELLYYYLRKKVAYEPIDLNVIRDVDLNKLEPWDLEDKCRIGSGPQDEWYCFSHKDKKYPTGTRTNRATAAGFWKATGRDKAIHLGDLRRIGMRKTLVSTLGEPLMAKRANGSCTSIGWMMRAYMRFRWMGCMQGFQEEEPAAEVHQPLRSTSRRRGRTRPPAKTCVSASTGSAEADLPDAARPLLRRVDALTSAAQRQILQHCPLIPHVSMNNNTLNHIHCSQHGRFSNGDWSILDKLLASQQSLLINQQAHDQLVDLGSSVRRFPLQYLGCEVDLLKFSE